MTPATAHPIRDELALDELLFPPLPAYGAQLMPIYWEPMMSSGERLAAVLAAIGRDQKVIAVSTLRPAVLKLLYPSAASSAGSIVAWVVQSIENHLTSFGSFIDWTPPFSGVFAGKVVDAVGVSLEDIIDQGKMLYCSLAAGADQADLADDDVFESMDTKAIRTQVLNRVRLRMGLSADNLIVDGGTLEVVDGEARHFLDIPLKTKSQVGSIVSAWYKTPMTVAQNILFAQNAILAAAERGKYEPGLFVARPYSGLPKTVLNAIDDRLDYLSWSMGKTGIAVRIADTTDQLADDVCDWAKV